MKKIIQRNQEHQVTDLRLSKKLKNLGAKQVSAYYWYYLEAEGIQGGTVSSTPALVDKTYRDEAVRGKYESDSAFLSAFSVAELGELLPARVEVENSLWRVYYVGDVEVNAVTEVEARALMLIYLLEHNLMRS
jgi:hypothetical protein